MSSDEWQEAKKNMKRKITVLALCAMLFALCSSADGAAAEEGPADRVSIVERPQLVSPPVSEAIRLALRERGYIEGQNIAIEYRYAEGKHGSVP